MPAKLHMTVPPGFRRNTDVPRVLVLHKANLHAEDVEEREGYRVAKPIRAITDLLIEGTEDRNQLRSALRESIDKGLITRRQIEQHARRKELQSLLGGKAG
jgi:hypothetical protein